MLGAFENSCTPSWWSCEACDINKKYVRRIQNFIEYLRISWIFLWLGSTVPSEYRRSSGHEFLTSENVFHLDGRPWDGREKQKQNLPDIPSERHSRELPVNQDPIHDQLSARDERSKSSASYFYSADSQGGLSEPRPPMHQIWGWEGESMRPPPLLSDFKLGNLRLQSPTPDGQPSKVASDRSQRPTSPSIAAPSSSGHPTIPHSFESNIFHIGDNYYNRWVFCYTLLHGH